jgi:hypothetical protein
LPSSTIRTRPDAAHQLVLAYNRAIGLDQRHEHIEGAPTEHYRPAVGTSRRRGKVLKRPNSTLADAPDTGSTGSDFSADFHGISYFFACDGRQQPLTPIHPCRQRYSRVLAVNLMN